MTTFLALALLVLAPAVDVTGVWSGAQFVITFKQEGAKLSGHGGPDAKEQYPFTGGTVEDDRLVFKVGEFNFDLHVVGDEIKGEMKSGDRSQPVSVKRVDASKPRVAPTAFEVASIKVNSSGSRGSSSHSRPGGVILMENISLKQLIERAYDVRDFSLTGPDWLDTARFDISAKPPEAVSNEEMRVLMQNLLIERFKLAVHREEKTMGAFALLPAKGGLKIKAVEPGPSGSNSTVNNGRGTLNGQKMTMARLADWLGQRVDRPVVDKTETPGMFDIKLEWVADNPSATPSTEAETPSGPSIYTALQEQLGLKLTSAKLPVQILVVDRVEKVPTEN